MYNAEFWHAMVKRGNLVQDIAKTITQKESYLMVHYARHNIASSATRCNLPLAARSVSI